MRLYHEYGLSIFVKKNVTFFKPYSDASHLNSTNPKSPNNKTHQRLCPIIFYNFQFSVFNFQFLGRINVFFIFLQVSLMRLYKCPTEINQMNQIN